MLHKESGQFISQETNIQVEVKDGEHILLISPVALCMLEIFIEKIKDASIEIIQKGILELQEYIFNEQFYNSYTPQSECKVVFIGTPGVGKSSMVEKIQKNTFEEGKSRPTKGISIENWYFKRDSRFIKLHLWDFGGQDNYPNIHHFFMTERTLYVLVINSRINDFYAKGDLIRWLRFIKHYVNNSPIIVALNRWDEAKFDIPKQEYLNDYKNIVEFIETSSKEGTGIERLKQSIINQVMEFDHLNINMDKSFYSIAKKLKEFNTAYLNFNEYKAICKSKYEKIHKVDELSDKDISFYLDLLNDLGRVIKITKGNRLPETNILNPEWLTTRIYDIIDNDLVKKQNGKLRVICRGHSTYIDDLSKIFTDKNIHVSFLMDILKQFKLCYQKEGSDIHEREEIYYFPIAFSQEKPLIQWQKNGNPIQLIYKYNIFDPIIIGHFIVDNSNALRSSDFWRFGCVLEYNEEKDKKVEALISCNQRENSAEIVVQGNGDKKYYFNKILSALDNIHGQIPELDIHRYIPVDNNLISYDNIKIVDEHKITEWFCPELKREVNVKMLLYGETERETVLSRIEKLVADNYLIDAIDELIHYNRKQDIKIQLINYKASLKDYNKGLNNGSISRRDYDLKISQIRKAILEEAIKILNTHEK